ncbi:hypothetical protein H6G80_22885 [Nostoc sp. FACHB-87]|uniref:calcium-binding protein n=1 Tax=Nostocaceae TaxID=1162 RepID=UPI00198B9E74|nr:MULTISPECIES: calcium-binding protein [Nostocaceae]MBD2456908.1 hypothetical protein [Nostoc sp. FACHB-87]MBD2478760.1 hypothetical protein [Anabaena sp. FACHB-83]
MTAILSLTANSLELKTSLLTVLQMAISLSQSRLQSFANDTEFASKIALAFHPNSETDSLKTSWINGDFRGFPLLEIHYQSELNGAIGAYSAETGIIYLAYEYLQQISNIQWLAGLILEEYGHYIDRVLNGSNDSDGDEGRIFSALVMEESLSETELKQLKAENDQAVISLNGVSIAVEMASLVGNEEPNIIIGTAGDDYIEGLGGNDTLDGGGGNDVVGGGEGSDLIIGGAGNDVLYGGAGDGSDILQGGEGNDDLDGAGGSDFLQGGGGNDTLKGGIGDSLDGGEGLDNLILYLQNTTNNWTLNLTATSVNLTGDINTTVKDLERISQIYTGSGNDIFNVTNYIFGGTIDGGAGIDILYADYSTATGSTIGVNNLGIGSISTYIYPLYSGGSHLFFYYLNFEGLNIVGTPYKDFLAGDNSNDTFQGGAGDDSLYGNGGNDSLTGDTGNDILDGGLGNDTMIGGLGDDSYYVDDVGDQIYENLNEGTDIVYSSISYTLSDHLENLTLTNASNINGTGNSLNNQITGSSGNNILDGKAGSDTLRGGAGNDTYVVDNVGDVVIEIRNQGIDTVIASISYTLGSTVENLTLVGTANINGTGSFSDNILIGNSGNNTLTGYAGNDTLDGGVGVDTLLGGLGDDIYIVDDVGDVVTENLNEGTDTVIATVNYILGNNLENLTLAGTANINGTGNALNNSITGNSGNNTLTGYAGNDILSGGTGNDFLLGGQGNDQLTGGEGVDFFGFSGVANFSDLSIDTITDFTKGSDLILLSHSLFNSLTMSNSIISSEFATITADSATEVALAGGSSAFLVYNTSTGNLFYNADGAVAGLGTGGQFAVLSNKPLLDSSDFSFLDFA